MATTAQELPFEIKGIRYSVCQPREVPDVIEVLARSFSRHDPPAVVLGITEADFKPYLALVTAGAGKHGLTIIARDVASNEMAGAVSTEDAGAPVQLDLDILSPRFAAIYDLFGELEIAIGSSKPASPMAPRSATGAPSPRPPTARRSTSSRSSGSSCAPKPRMPSSCATA